jgi:hypothetical protein
MTIKTIDDRIEEMLISKIAHYRLSVRELFRKRHNVAWPTLIRKEINHDIRRLRMWQRMAEQIESAHVAPFTSSTPYTTYLAKQLS